MNDSADQVNPRSDETDPEKPIIAHWPGDWPGRQFVELDSVGDPGSWIDEQLPSAAEVLLGDPADDEATAEVFADAYISAGREFCFPLPTDFGMTEDEMRQIAISDFLGFIHEWRRRTLAEQVSHSAVKRNKLDNSHSRR